MGSLLRNNRKKSKPKAFEMMLLGFLLLAATSVARRAYDYNLVQLCIQDNAVKMLVIPPEYITSTSHCMADRIDVIHKGSDTSVSLARKSITGFKRRWFRLPDRIHTVYLDHNKIAEMTKAVLNDLPRAVTKVLLHNNLIERLRVDTIDNYYLEWLDISNNRVKEIESGALTHLPNLKYLSLSHNYITELSFVATVPPGLRALYLNDNLIKGLPRDLILKHDNLEILELRYNLINNVPEQAFSGLTNLYYYDVGKNPIRMKGSGKVVLKEYPQIRYKPPGRR